MALISKEEIIKLARISRISIHDDEIEPLAQQLDDILTYAARVSDIASSVQQASEPQNSNIFREDVLQQCNAERILAAAPEQESHYFVVPAILEQE